MVIESFKLYLEGKAYSKNTIDGYSGDILQFLAWLDCNKLMLSAESVAQYRQFSLYERRNNPKTINRKLCAISIFGTFLIGIKKTKSPLVIDNFYIQVDSDYVNPTIISEQEVEEFSAMIAETENGIRNTALVKIFEYGGLRISEALGLLLEDVDLINEIIWIRNAKRVKTRKIFLIPKSLNPLKNYLAIRNEYRYAGKSNFVFLGKYSKHLDPSTVNKLFKKVDLTGKITPHQLRHLFSSRLLELGFTLAEIAMILGHRSIKTTIKYTHPREDEIRKKMEML